MIEQKKKLVYNIAGNYEYKETDSKISLQYCREL